MRAHRRLQSTIKNNRRHPVWNETFRLLVHQPDEDRLTCLLYDYDMIRADALVGRFALFCGPHKYLCLCSSAVCNRNFLSRCSRFSRF